MTASRRAQQINGSLLLSLYAIATEAGIVITAMLATGTLIEILVNRRRQPSPVGIDNSISSIERRTRGSPFNVDRQGAGPISFDMDFPVVTQRAIPMD